MDRYDITKSFEKNRIEGPYGFDKIKDRNEEIDRILGDCGIEKQFFSFKTKLPLGVGAGPLFNERYMKTAAKDGFTVITWKTFRTISREAHKNDGTYLGHNIVTIPSPTLLRRETKDTSLQSTSILHEDREKLTITNSFGMPSAAPEQWKPAVAEVEKWMRAHGKQAITSVVGTPREGWGLKELAEDYALCAELAREAGAEIIEMNFSCPNVHGKEGTIYKSPAAAALICETVRRRVDDAKLLIKVGWAEKEEYRRVLSKTNPFIDGITAINTIPMKVIDEHGNRALPGGLISGVCGYAILDMAVEAVSVINELRIEENWDLVLISCGGVTSPEAAMRHVEAGSDMVTVATAALFYPDLPVKFAEYIRAHNIRR